MSRYYKIGKFVATHGLKGDIVLQHNLGKKTSLKGLEAIFLEQGKDSFLPYFIISTSIKNEKELFIKLEGADTKEMARKFISKEVWLSEEDFKQFASMSSPIAMLGCTMINGNEDLGEIMEVIEQPHQILCSIQFNGKEALIPVHEQSLKKIDLKNKKVFVNLPEGLLDIYR